MLGWVGVVTEKLKLVCYEDFVVRQKICAVDFDDIFFFGFGRSFTGLFDFSLVDLLKLDNFLVTYKLCNLPDDVGVYKHLHPNVEPLLLQHCIGNSAVGADRA